MSRFHRSGHWRTNSYGTTYWISGHSVERYDWDRYSSYSSPAFSPPPPPASPIEAQVWDGHRASFTIPNAACPVCGASVFFYQNEHGSRVFFDDLGPPWPKHPCTDNGSRRVDHSITAGGVPSTISSSGQESHRPPRLETEEFDASGPADNSYVAPLHTGDGWDRCIVKKRTERDGTSHFVVYNVSDLAKKSIRFSTPARSDFPGEEETLYLKGDRLSFFSFEEFAPLEVQIERKKSKAASGARKRRSRRKRKRK